MASERAQKFPKTFRFTYAHTRSIGFSSGAYGGKYTSDRRVVEIHERLNCLRPMDACIVQRHHDFSLDVTQEMLEESDDISTADGSQCGVLEEVPVGRDRANGGELLPIGGQCDQGRDAPDRPRPPPDPLEREPHLIQIDQGGALSDFFLMLVPFVPARTRSEVHCAQRPVHPASVE